MKILAISDIHSRLRELSALVEKAGKYDLCILAGDLTNYGAKQDAEAVINLLPKPCYAVPGNMDSAEVINELEKAGLSVHCKTEKFQDLEISGVGGGWIGGPGPVNFSEEEFAEKLSQLNIGKNTVLVTHLPPYDSRIDSHHSGQAIGGKSIRKAIEDFSPLLSISGHVHESFGVKKIGSTLCINVASVKEGRAALIDASKKEAKFLEL